MASTRKDTPRSSQRRRTLGKAAATSDRPFHFSSQAARVATGSQPTDLATTPPLPSEARALDVLLIDDSVTGRSVLVDQLRAGLDDSLRVRTASSGREALAMLRGQTFDLALIHHDLPDTNGPELIERLTELDDRMAKIVVSDADSAALAAGALQAGAHDYLVRSQLTPESLGRAATTAVRTARLEDKNRRRIERLHDVAETTDHFIRALSHDMSASMMVLEDSLTRVENSCREAGISSAISEQFAHVTACLDQSKRLLDDLVSLAETGSPGAETGDVDVAQIANRVLYEQGAAIDRRGVEVTIASELGTAHCDANRLERLLTNLVRNALAHGCDSQRPQLSIETAGSHSGGDDRRIWLRVWDNGPGIPSDIREQVFQPGKRHGSTAGSGMGLAIARRIVSEHGGTVMVDPACHEGTAIIFSLPAAADA